MMCQTLGYHHSFMNSFININRVPAGSGTVPVTDTKMSKTDA